MILDFAIRTLFGLVLCLGWCRGLRRLFLGPLASLLLSACLLDRLLAAASLRAFADMLRVLRLVILWIAVGGVSSSWLGVDVFGGGGGSGVSASLLLLLLSKTIAAASSHVGMRGIVVEGVGRCDNWVTGDVGAFVGVTGVGGGVGVSSSLLLLLLSKTAAAASSHVGIRGILVGSVGPRLEAGFGVVVGVRWGSSSMVVGDSRFLSLLLLRSSSATAVRSGSVGLVLCCP